MGLVVEQYREQDEDGLHGDVHLLAHVTGVRRRGLLLCGRKKEGMRKQTTPFRGSNGLMCRGCGRFLVAVTEGLEGVAWTAWERIKRHEEAS